jgi:hypothetical protein
MRSVVLLALLLAAACKKDDAQVKPLGENEKFIVKTGEPKPKPPEPTEVERMCARLKTFAMATSDASTSKSDEEAAKCVAELEKMKKDEPNLFNCIAECTRTAEDADAATTCLLPCAVNSKTFQGMMSAAGDK